MEKVTFFLLWFFGVVLDQTTKWWAEGVLKDRVIALVPGVLRFHLRQNFASAFGLYFLTRPQHAVVTLGVTVFLLFLLFSKRVSRPPLFLLGGSLYLAGAWGNLVDRLWRGYVVDFIEPSFWATFNVADVLIVTGAASMVWGFLRHEERKNSRL
ncbi:MAG: signal peptidase II [Candidatus Caldatribacterium sp.]|uniref:signal peptidase II n=1 Tax=Candidatus Caldatribacterium sp. TaxID=2282143 RepID=UPI002993E28F|nr:signal peptidase II [Candidatus Caldatribacterium sp.]MCX7729826.1 signal peptidase II [Candidatus Caldatribacterium sp.]MDW8080461.1 signal peptidase II [Candidatus Calescibacterium sp.]